MNRLIRGGGLLVLALALMVPSFAGDEKTDPKKKDADQKKEAKKIGDDNDKKKAEPKKELIDQLAKVNANQSVSVIMLESALANAPVPALMKLTSITGGLTLTDELKAEFNLNTKNADDAKTIGEEARDGLNQAKAIVALMAAQQKQLAPLADILTSVKVNTKGTSISVIGGVSKQQLDELMKQIPKR